MTSPLGPSSANASSLGPAAVLTRTLPSVGTRPQIHPDGRPPSGALSGLPLGASSVCIGLTRLAWRLTVRASIPIACSRISVLKSTRPDRRFSKTTLCRPSVCRGERVAASVVFTNPALSFSRRRPQLFQLPADPPPPPGRGTPVVLDRWCPAPGAVVEGHGAHPLIRRHGLSAARSSSPATRRAGLAAAVLFSRGPSRASAAFARALSVVSQTCFKTNRLTDPHPRTAPVSSHTLPHTERRIRPKSGRRHFI